MSCVIGGDGIIVELDETKLARRKYNRGHHVEGTWVIEGVERSAERKLFAVEVEDRSESTIRNVIEEHVAPGSVIHTDCWKAYAFLGREDDYENLTVNHSKTFKDILTGVHTNTIEGTWNALKRKIPARNRTASDLGDHLYSFIWNRQHACDLWNAFWTAMRSVPYM